MDPIEKLGDEIAELAAHLDSATQQLLARVRAFDEASGWSVQGATSCARWLAWRLGLDTATAREKVRVARALGVLPRVDEAFGRGELSYAKVRALTRVATPENEVRLLDLARHATGAQLERLCRGYRQVLREEGREAPEPEERAVRERVLPGGMVKLEMVLHPDEAAVVLQAIEKAREALYRAKGEGERAADVSAEGSIAADGVSANRADGAISMAETFLASGTGADQSGSDRHQIVIHVDQEVLHPDGEWSATLEALGATRVTDEKGICRQ
jgi:hypothetical protein